MALNPIEVKTFPALIKLIKEELAAGKTAAQQALENIKVLAYFNIGKYIKAHLNYKRYAHEAGDRLIEQVAAAIEMGSRTVYRIVQFYECYAKMLSNGLTTFSWSHYILFLRIKDPQKRLVYEQKVLEKHLGVEELENLLKKDKIIAAGKQGQRVVLSESKGLPHYYRLLPVEPLPDLCIDCGFRIYRELPPGSTGYAAENIVEIIENSGTYNIRQAANINPDNLYNYKAFVIEIIDGDTLWLTVELGFGLRSRLKMRLRGLNAEDVASQAGIRCRAYVAQSLSGCAFVLIKSHKRDKYNRYLVDVYFQPGAAHIGELVQGGRFLNQELLDTGLASRYVE